MQGTAPYTYQWDAAAGNQTTATATGLAPGSYSVTFTDASGSQALGQVEIPPPLCSAYGPQIESAVTPATCGQSDGALDVSGTEGTAPLSYAWSANAGGATGPSISGMAAEVYSVTVTDAYGCTATSSPEITTNTALHFTTLSATSCGATLSSMSEYVRCNTVPGAQRYQFELTTPGGFHATVFSYGSNPFCSLISVPGLTLGSTYNVRVRVKKNGCWNDYGTPCPLNTPADIPSTSLQSSYCNSTLGSINQYVYCTPVGGAQRYEYEFALNGDTMLAYSPSSNPSGTFFSLLFAPTVQYSATYSVRVRARVGGMWGSFGSACNLTTPPAPSTSLQAAYCGITLSALNNYIYCAPVTG